MRKLLIWTTAILGMAVISACTRETDRPGIETDSALSRVYGIQADDENLIQGEMIVRLTQDLSDLVEAQTGEDGEVRVNQVPALKSPAQTIDVRSMRRLFPYAGKFEERTRKEGLHLWYKVTFDEKEPLTRAASEFVGLDGVDIVELNPKIEIVGNPEVVGYVSARTSGITQNAALPFNDPQLSKQWHYYNDGTAASAQSGCDINVFPVWKSYTTGNPDVIVSVVDGGIDYEHEDLADNMWHNPDKQGNGQYGYNFCTNNFAVTADNHGTHVAGTIAAVNNNGIGVSGIAGGDFAKKKGGVKLMSCQIFSDKGGSGSGAEAIKWGADHGAVISQNSWGYTDATMTEAPASVKAAADYFIKYAGFDEKGNQVGPMAGGIVIFAAGNENQDHSSTAYEKILNVTSVGADYRRAYYSNWGPYANIAAPGGDVKKGNQVLSTLPGNKYGLMQGTSMACPHVSGVAALIVSKFGGIGFTPEALWKRLVENTTDITAYNRNYYMGNGLVNAYRAIAGSGGKAPDMPTDLTATSKSNNIDFTVTVPSDSDDGKPTSIIIYYDTDNITDVSQVMFSNYYVGDLEPGQKLSGTVTGLEFNTQYYITAVACDLAGNKSKKTVNVKVTTGGNNAPVIKVTSPTSFELKPHETAKVVFTAEDPDGHFINYDLQKASEAEVLDTLDKSKPKIDIIAVNAPTGTYRSKLVITDLYGASSELDFQYTILENHVPEKVNALPDQIFSSLAQTLQLNEKEYFKDDDGEQLSYTITNTDENVANVNYSKGVFYITSLNLGYSEVVVTATDIRGATVSQTFRILVRESSEAVDLYPNPVKDYLYVRTSETASADLKVISSLGRIVFEEALSISPFTPATVDMRKMAGGIYTVQVTYNGETFTKTIVKL